MAYKVTVDWTIWYLYLYLYMYMYLYQINHKLNICLSFLFLIQKEYTLILDQQMQVIETNRKQ